MMILWLLAQLALSRPYHIETIDSLPTSLHTHVQTTGTVTLVKKEQDGDIHIRVSDAHGHFVVCEIIPGQALKAPIVGQGVVVYGIRRFDNERGHGWWELHPLERWTPAVK